MKCVILQEKGNAIGISLDTKNVSNHIRLLCWRLQNWLYNARHSLIRVSWKLYPVGIRNIFALCLKRKFKRLLIVNDCSICKLFCLFSRAVLKIFQLVKFLHYWVEIIGTTLDTSFLLALNLSFMEFFSGYCFYWFNFPNRFWELSLSTPLSSLFITQKESISSQKGLLS